MLPETSSENSSKSCNDTISQKGFRFTAQRREVYDEHADLVREWLGGP